MTANAKAKRTVVELDRKLTVDEICADLGSPGKPLSRRTFYEWRMKGTGPECIKLPNGTLLVEASEYNRWLKARKEAA